MRVSSSFLFLLFVILFFSSPGSAAPVTSTATWINTADTAFALDLSYSMCPALGSSTITATVTGISSGNTIVDANVYATIRKPDTTSADYNFTNTLNGIYSLSFNFDQNGTYLIQGHAFKPPNITGDANGYAYVNTLNWTTSFLNNSFSLNSGDQGTIRNLVRNVDNNIVYDINANTTLYYPNGTVFDANATMTQTPNGEFAYAFIAPSTAGVYTAATIFKCGTLYDYNNAGRFTVNVTSTGGGDPGTGTGGGGGIGGGGGGGGGVKTAQIISVDFQPEPSKNSPSRMSATIQNLSTLIKDFLVTYQITSPSGIITTGEKLIEDVVPITRTTLVLDPAFMPLELGEYTLNVRLKTPNGIGTFDIYEDTFNVEGAHALSFDVQPVSLKTALGLTFPFTIHILNNGDFDEENVQITWFITNPMGNEYTRSTFSTTINAGETKTLPYSAFIPLDSQIGLHQLTVQVIDGIAQEKIIVFQVSSPNDYYAELISDLEMRIDQIEDKIDDLEQRGFDVGEVQVELVGTQTDLARAKAKFLAGNYEGLNTDLTALSARVTRLAAMVDALEQQSPLLSREGLTLILYFGGLILFLLFLYLLFFYIRRRKKEDEEESPYTNPNARPRWLARGLGVDKMYHPPEQRDKLREKPLISGILGMKEEK